MDNDVDDLDDLFERRSSGDEDQSKENKSENVNNTDKATGVPVPVKKRIVRNPRLKFNADRLCGERGIPVLVDHFKNVKFKGKGHEKEDLEKLLATLEHWTHRLFPSMKFLDCLRQIEKLGKKRPVQTCLHKIRLDMPILSADFVGDDEDRPQESGQSPEPEVEVDPFDALISQNRHEEPVQHNFNTPSPSQNIGQVLGSSYGCNLTDEQRKRMEYNRMLATERRKAKLIAVQRSLNPDLEDSINLAESTRKDNSFNEASCPDESTDLSGDIFQSTSSQLLEPESESLLQSYDKNHSNKTQSSQDISCMSIDQDVVGASASEEGLISNKDPDNGAETLEKFEDLALPSPPPKNNLNDIDHLVINEVPVTNDEKQFDVEDDGEAMDVDSINLETEPVEKDVIFEDNGTLSPQTQLSNTSQNHVLDMKSSDTNALSQSILEVNEDFSSNSKAVDQRVKEIPCTSDVDASKEDSDELKMDELMDLIDE